MDHFFSSINLSGLQHVSLSALYVAGTYALARVGKFIKHLDRRGVANLLLAAEPLIDSQLKSRGAQDLAPVVDSLIKALQNSVPAPVENKTDDTTTNQPQ